MAIEEKALRRVVAGMLWLDMVAPGWQPTIDWGHFDITTAEDCVLGQVFDQRASQDPWVGGFVWAAAHFRLGATELVDLGFMYDSEVSEVRLENAWLALAGQGE